ncbi:MAG: two pore domain potassium channel family protein [Bradyrhizobiaceae bacterium]|nr:MAG: two pore domain potassium channel family protein [Bradyrhizobiaceae bacterium]
MKSLITGLRDLFSGFVRGLHDPEFRAIGFLLLVAVATGAVFFKWAEGWSWLDSAYFSVVSLTTVGDANIAPSAAISKIFTMGYSLAGIGLMLAFVSRLASFRGDDGKEDID